MGHPAPCMTSAIDKLIEADKRSPKKIMVVGDPMTDVYVRGYIGECQDGCPKFIEDKRIAVLGGAGNAAHTLMHWNADVSFLFSGFPGPVKTRFLVDEQCVFRHDDDRYDCDFESVRLAVLGLLRGAHYDAVLISDYDKGVMTNSFIANVAEICREHGVPCVADAKRGPLVYANCILKCNHDYSAKYNKWYEKHDGPSVLTLGEQYPILNPTGKYDDAMTERTGFTPRVPCINHIGAGDCFGAHLTLALAYGLSLKEAAGIAHSAGRVYVQYPNNRAPRLAEIRADMESWDTMRG